MLLAADAGSSTPANLPVERGFTSSLGYMGGAEDHYNQIGDYKEGGDGSLSGESDVALGLPGAFLRCCGWRRRAGSSLNLHGLLYEADFSTKRQL